MKLTCRLTFCTHEIVVIFRVAPRFIASHMDIEPKNTCNRHQKLDRPTNRILLLLLFIYYHTAQSLSIMTGLESRTIDSEYIDVKMAKQHPRQPQQITRTMRIHSRYDEKNIFKLIRNGRFECWCCCVLNTRYNPKTIRSPFIYDVIVLILAADFDFNSFNYCIVVKMLFNLFMK